MALTSKNGYFVKKGTLDLFLLFLFVFVTTCIHMCTCFVDVLLVTILMQHLVINIQITDLGTLRCVIYTLQFCFFVFFFPLCLCLFFFFFQFCGQSSSLKIRAASMNQSTLSQNSLIYFQHDVSIFFMSRFQEIGRFCT